MNIVAYLLESRYQTFISPVAFRGSLRWKKKKKKRGGLLRSANVSLYELTLAQAGTEGPEEMSYTFLESCRLFMTGY